MNIKTTVLFCLFGSACLSNACAPAAAQDIPNADSSYEERLPPKIHRIQKELPTWSEKPGNKEKAAAFMQKLKEQLDAMNFAEAEKTADAFLKMMGVSTPTAAQGDDNTPQQAPPTSSPSNDTKQRLTEKVDRVKAGAQKWAASRRDPSEIAKTMVEKFKPLMEAGKVVEAEAVLDRVLEQLGEEGNSTATPTASGESAQQRVAAKLERVAQGVQRWAAIAKMMEEKVKPLLEAGKYVEAEAELDRVLGTKDTSQPAADPTTSQDASSYQERLPPKIHRIQKELPIWCEKPGNQEKAAAFMQKLKEQLDAMDFAEAEKTADAILKTMGVSTPAAAQGSENTPRQAPPSNSASNDTRKRLTEKVERVEAGVQKWESSGRDPSEIGKRMVEEFKPLMEAGKVVEAEAVLDRVLEQLDKDAN